MSKISSTFEVRIFHDMFSTKALLKQSLRGSFDFVSAYLKNIYGQYVLHVVFMGIDIYELLLGSMVTPHACSVDVPLTDQRHATFFHYQEPNKKNKYNSFGVEHS